MSSGLRARKMSADYFIRKAFLLVGHILRIPICGMKIKWMSSLSIFTTGSRARCQIIRCPSSSRLTRASRSTPFKRGWIQKARYDTDPPVDHHLEDDELAAAEVLNMFPTAHAVEETYTPLKHADVLQLMQFLPKNAPIFTLIK
ncbi:hypothetical protein FRC08_001405 [Ceratobasidium sp. 394]|nr:hypothetical protein FRC08_001405 [Ceratobasidium sp. 394]